MSNIIKKSRRNESIDIKSIFSFHEENTFSQLENYNETIKNIFNEYCLIGEKNNSLDISLSGYLKFVQDLNLIKDSKGFNINNTILNNNNNNINQVRNKLFTKNDICIIFNDICGIKNFESSRKIKTQFSNNSTNIIDFSDCKNYANLSHRNYSFTSRELKSQRMNFSLFLKSFEILGRRLYQEETNQNAFNKFFNEIFLEFLNKKKFNSSTNSLKKNIFENLEKIKAEEMLNLKEVLFNEIFIHYKKYVNNDKFLLIDYSEFSKFFSDFEIFPNYLNIIQLKTIYYTMNELFLEEINENENDKNIFYRKNYENIKKNLLINFEYFLDALCLTSTFIKINDDNIVENFIYMISKMGSSKAMKKIEGKSREKR